MIYSSVNKIYFSPSGSVANIVKKFSAHLTIKQTDYNLLTKNIDNVTFADDEFLIAASPVFSGRIPSVYLEKLKKMKGSNTPAVIIAVYGNREYEDALIELKDTLESQGFIVVAAAAFIARHSIFPKIASARPDEKDDVIIADFADKSMQRIEQIKSTSDIKPIEVKGNRPYRTVSKIPIQPSASSKCKNCGACAKVCPVGAIDAQNQKKYDKTKCISCSACIKVCAHSARNFRGLLYWFAQRQFVKKFSARKEPELFF